MEAWVSTPRTAFLSPKPGSGKPRALEHVRQSQRQKLQSRAGSRGKPSHIPLISKDCNGKLTFISSTGMSNYRQQLATATSRIVANDVCYQAMATVTSMADIRRIAVRLLLGKGAGMVRFLSLPLK
jgi:hypothetical protein